MLITHNIYLYFHLVKAIGIARKKSSVPPLVIRPRLCKHLCYFAPPLSLIHRKSTSFLNNLLLKITAPYLNWILFYVYDNTNKEIVVRKVLLDILFKIFKKIHACFCGHALAVIWSIIIFKFTHQRHYNAPDEKKN